MARRTRSRRCGGCSSATPPSAWAASIAFAPWKVLWRHIDMHPFRCMIHMANVYTTLGDAPVIREDWLQQMIDLLRPDFEQVGSPLPEKIRVSCGFPSKSALSPNKARRIGECWGVEAAKTSRSRSSSPRCSRRGVEVSATLVHELVHTAVGIECKHRGPFRRGRQGHRAGRENDGHRRG